MRRENRKIWIARFALTLACAFVFAWIFSNSLKTGAESSAQSHAVTNAVQSVAQSVAPSSSVATAKGKAYENLHNAIRKIAHFSEFALLGALLIWCYLSYTKDKAFCVLPFGLILLTPIVDECLQTFTGGRGAELADVFLDTVGGFLGALVAFLAVWAVRKILQRKKRKGGAIR